MIINILLLEIKVSLVALVAAALVLLSLILDAGLSSRGWVSEVSLKEKDAMTSPTIGTSSVNS